MTARWADTLDGRELGVSTARLPGVALLFLDGCRRHPPRARPRAYGAWSLVRRKRDGQSQVVDGRAARPHAGSTSSPAARRHGGAKGRVAPEDGLPSHREVVRLSSDGRVDVVGESHYQPAIRASAGALASRGWEEAVAVEAVLIPEPQNRYDSNAVRVAVDGRTVGYLSRENAVQYQPQLLDLLRAGSVGWCPAYLCGGGDRYYGVFLRLGRPGSLLPLNSPDGMMILGAERQVTVTGEECHQDVLTELAARGRGSEHMWLFASLHACPVTKGKYAGAAGVEVRVDGRRVGELTKLQADRCRFVVESAEAGGEQPGCEATLRHSDKGWQVELQLPRGGRRRVLMSWR